MLEFALHMRLQLAEMTGKIRQLGNVQQPVAESQDPVIQKRLFDCRDCFGIDRLAGIQAADFSAKKITEGRY